MDVLVNQLKNTKPENAMDVLKQVCQYAPSLDDAIIIIERISKGEDGISGTEDDLISEEILESLRILVRQDMVKLLISHLYIDSDAIFCKCFK